MPTASILLFGLSQWRSMKQTNRTTHQKFPLTQTTHITHDYRHQQDMTCLLRI